MKNLKIYGNFLRNKLNFQMSNCKLQQKPYTLNFESNDVLQSQNQKQMSNQILTVCKLILNQSQFDMIINY